MEIIELVIALAITAIVMAGAIMIPILLKENKELKQKISKLNTQLIEANSKIYSNLEEIRLLKWQITNPPKYKKGEKFGELIITSHELHKPTLSGFLTNAVIGFISFCAGYTSERKKYTDLDMYWQYQLTHTISGAKHQMTELDLTNFISAAK